MGGPGSPSDTGGYDERVAANAKRKAKWLVLTAAEAKARIAERGLARAFHRLALHALRRDATVLWCDGAWARPRKAPLPDLADVALIVVDGPLRTKGGLSLRYDDLAGGGFVARDDTAFLFLGEVRAQDVFTVPGVLALFPAGVTVERLASFEGADGHVLIAHHLHAPIVVSGVSGSGATLVKDTQVRIGAYARHIFGLAKKATRSFDELAELLPFLADEVDDVDAWELLEGLKGRKLPKSFALPACPPPTHAPGGSAARSKGPPKRVAKTAAPPARASRTPLEDFTRKFENPAGGTFCHVVVTGTAYALHRGYIGKKATRPLVFRFASREEAHAEARAFIKQLHRKPWREEK